MIVKARPVELRVPAGVAEWVRGRGGPLSVWTATHRCCTVPLTLFEDAADRLFRGFRDFRLAAGDGSLLFVDTGYRREPRALVVEPDRRDRGARLDWNDSPCVE